LHQTVVKRGQYRDAPEDAIERIATAPAHRPEVERMILFGSYVRGRKHIFIFAIPQKLPAMKNRISSHCLA
jgi:hypothetical protein